MSINKRRLKNQVALVTGCGSEGGIGFTAAALFVRSGASVAITSTTDRIFKRRASLEAARMRLVHLIRSALVPVRKRKSTRLTRGSVQRRMDGKTRRGRQKALRRKVTQ